MRYFFTHITETERAVPTTTPEKFNQILLSEINGELRNAYMKNIYIKDNKISFVGNFFRFVWNGFNMFNPISSGEVKFKKIGKSSYIYYKLSFWEFFIIALIFSTIPILGIFPAFIYRFLSMGIIWMIYLIATIIATHRFENYLKKIVLKNGGKI